MNTNYEKFSGYFSQKQGEVFSSPRALFGRGEEELFTLVNLDDEKEEIKLKKEDNQEVVIGYQMIKEGILLLEDKKIVSITPENIPNAPPSLEENLAIRQSQMEDTILDKKDVPYIADLIVLSGIAAYGWGKTSTGDKFAAIAIKEKPEKMMNEEKNRQNKIPSDNAKPVNVPFSTGKIKGAKTENSPPRPVLITYSTRHGSTADIAWSVKNSFQDDGIYSEVKRIQDVDDVRKYSLVIIGTPIYENKVLPEIIEFARLHRDSLSKRMTAIFVVGISLKDRNDETILKTLRIADEIGKYIKPVDFGMFAGKILQENLSLKDRINALFKKEKSGDFRDWREIGEWADKIKRIYLQKID
ncbi:MAG: hypothetical protein JXQ82_04750 [Methanomicrobiaceae archaeon]|nr:hypothetical protein [Methanomicrobiaceae archaeon]